MKKFLVASIVAGAACAALVSIAQTDVYSGNAVGFVKITVPPSGQMVMAGFNFKPIGADAISLKDLFGTNQFVQANTAAKSTRIYIWNPALAGGGGYETYYQKPNGSFYDVTGTVLSTNPVIRAGDGFWLQSPNGASSNATIFVMGEVVSTGSFSRVETSGMMIIGNPYAAALDLNDTNLTWVADGATPANTPSKADTVYIWNGSGYNTFFLNKASGKWCEAVSPYPVATNAIIQVGGAAWYKGKNTFTNRLVRPYPWWN